MPVRDGNVVEHDREVRRVGDRAAVRDDARLGGLVVVRRHEEECVGSGRGRAPRHVHRVAGVVRPDARHDRRAVPRPVLHAAHQRDALVVGEGGRLPRRAVDDDAVMTGSEQVVDERVGALVVDLAVR